jgi:hypothetical protein
MYYLSRAKSYGYILGQLLRTDFKIFKQTIIDKIIDMSIWTTMITFVFGYLMPKFGIDSAFINVQVAGMVASAAMFNLFPSVIDLVSDFEGDRVVSFYSTLPIPTWLIFVRFFIYYALTGIIMVPVVLPVAKLILGSLLDLSAIHFGKFLFIIVLTNFTYGALILLMASMIPSMQRLGSIWMRFIYPMWMLGGFQFTWYVLYQVFPYIALADLLNPMIYVMEGNKVALLGQEGFLPFWYCVAALVFFTITFMIVSIRRLKRRLDFV